MARRHSRSYIHRKTYPTCSNRTKIRNNFIYY